jgi:hypothetical protein
MTPTDTKTLADRLLELADAVGAKAPGDAGLKAWYIALKDFAIEDIVGSLDTWLRTRPKMPSPSDVRAILLQRTSDQAARDDRVKVLSFGFGPPPKNPQSPAYLKFKAWWAAFKRAPPTCQHPDFIASFVRVGAIIAPETPLSEAERELLAEREAIIAEGSA